jgi:hypothetical protein
VSLHTKDGEPLNVRGDKVFSQHGNQIGRIKGSKVFGPDGSYVGTIVSDRLVYRSTDGASIVSPFVPSVGSPTARASRAGSAVWGDEPRIR